MGISPYIIKNDPETFGTPYRLIHLEGGGIRVVLLPQTPAPHKISETNIPGTFPPLARPEDHCWVGNNYKVNARKLLILSESFYDRNKDLTNDPNPSKKLVEWCAISHPNRFSYYSKLVRLCSGSFGQANTPSFWHEVSLLHFVRQGLDRPRATPSQDQMRASILRCVRLVEALTPSAILVPSKRLWRFLLAEGLVTETDGYRGHFHAFIGPVHAAAIGHPASATKFADSKAQIVRLLRSISAR